MSTSGEIQPDCIINYYLTNYEGCLSSFSILPLQWNDEVLLEGSHERIFLGGTADDGLTPIYKKVTAWKFQLYRDLPEIYVLPKDGVWIKLHKPRKDYVATVKTILVSIHCLHFLKYHPGESSEALWNILQSTLRTFEILPSESDLLHHIPIVLKVAEKDRDISKSKYLSTFFMENTGKTRENILEKDSTRRRQGSIVDDDRGCDDDGGGSGAHDDDDDDGDDVNDDDDDDALFDHVCGLCDNGGKLLCCEGKCLRSFHPTIDSGSDSLCQSLGYTENQIEAIETFWCNNCKYNQHQCSRCGVLGSSDRSAGAEVFPCISATCGHFYHPKCVVQILFPLNKIHAEELQNKIASGESFLCPVHKCYECKQVEDKEVHEMQFAICRRCPKAYHRKCLPRSFENSLPQRSWDGLLPNRILIYCWDHKIIPKIGTPRRDHLLLFTEVDRKNQQHSSGLSSNNPKTAFRRSKFLGILEVDDRLNGLLEQRNSSTKDGVYPRVPSEPRDQSNKKYPGYGQQSLSKSLFKPSQVAKSRTFEKSDKQGLVFKLKINANQRVLGSQINRNTTSNHMIPRSNSTSHSVNVQLQSGIETLIKEVNASFNAEEFMNEQQRNTMASSFQKLQVDKTFTLGKVELAVEATRAALRKLDEGGTVEEAKSICAPEILTQIFKWKRKLGVYLNPFLHGMRYSSFGRHFTKLDKLRKIVDRLCWYVQDGDTVVDFCCGSNDFSCLMKEELEKLGKNCSFRNFDLIQPKKDFNFERKDWMTVQVEELPEGSNLIMGLNPPFGVEASLANQFIDKALTFKPKLLILIVPKETARLDEKSYPYRYDLIWKDDHLLDGKSFYIPGSLDVHDQQMNQWNFSAPPLYLWSRSDWTARHRAIAQKNDHIEGNNYTSPPVSNYLMEEKHDCYGDFSGIFSGCSDINKLLDDVSEVSDGNQSVNLKLPGKQVLDQVIGSLPAENAVFNDDTCMDMELSSPAQSPITSRNPPSSKGDSFRGFGDHQVHADECFVEAYAKTRFR
ncbi:hypothetical protein Leryth_012239 [Lithospermum erythrorhizon]|nr:hypothetical protein Leryth_012239 [Lithospermum erythrorhizon]